MQLFHRPSRVSATFDDANLVSAAGLVPAMALAVKSGLGDLADAWLTLPGYFGANSGLKVTALVAGMVAGADSIDDMALLRHGGMRKLFAGTYAPSTLGSFLRSFTFGHVRQLDAVAWRWLVNIAALTPIVAGIDDYALVDIDDTIKEVHGYQKQGSGYGYSGVRGLNAPIGIVSTPDAAPLIIGSRLRKGATGSPRGAGKFVGDILATVTRLRSKAATGVVLLRADSAFYNHAVVAAAHRGIPDRDCFTGILIRLVTGCSWDVAARLSPASETTLRARRTEWLTAGVFDKLLAEALAVYDPIIGLDLSDVAVDGSLHKAPCGGEGTGPNPTDRGKNGGKWSVATDRWGIPLGWTIEGANRNDSILLAPTLEAVAGRGLLTDVETLHLDKGYDSEATRTRCAEAGLTDVVRAKKRRTGEAKAKKERTVKPQAKKPHTLGMRWPVEPTNSWISNFGQLRRNTDRFRAQRLGQIALAVALILTVKLVKLVKWAKRWTD